MVDRERGAAPEEEVHIQSTEASGGSKEGVVRWVLVIGTLLAIVLLSLIWIIPAAMQEEGAESEISVSNTIAEEESGTDTDAIVSDGFDEIESVEGTDIEGLDVVENDPETEE